MKPKTHRPAYLTRADNATDRLVARMVTTLLREEDARRPVVGLTEEQRHRHAKVIDLVRMSRKKSLRRAHGRTAAR